MSKYCPKCRAEYYGTATICKKCKLNLVNYEEVPPRCPSCKKTYSFQETICEECLCELNIFQKPNENNSINSNIEYAELVTIYETTNIAELALIKGMFEQEDIHYNARGENLQSLFALGLIGGFNPIVGAIKIDVALKDKEKATKILKDLFENKELNDNTNAL